MPTTETIEPALPDPQADPRMSRVIGLRDGCVRTRPLRQLMDELCRLTDGAFRRQIDGDDRVDTRGCAGGVSDVGLPEPDRSPIHIAMRINGAFLVVQSAFPDVVVSRAPNAGGSSPVVIFVYVADVDQAVERAVGMGAKIVLPAQDQFWGDRTARIIDPSGHVWTVASRIEETTQEQRQRRWSDIRDGSDES